MYECIYEDENIRIRKANIGDVHDVHRIINNQKVMEYYGESATTLESAESEIKWFNSLFNMNSGRWIIEDRNSGHYIGDIGVFDYNDKHKKGEIGFKLDDNYWGQGIMSNCLQAVMRIVFEDWGYNRVEAIVDVRNVGCIKLLKKNCFVKEGTLREYEFEHGHYVNLEMHSILCKEFIDKSL